MHSGPNFDSNPANRGNFMIDFFEDNMLEEVDSQGVLDLKDPVEFFFD